MIQEKSILKNFSAQDLKSSVGGKAWEYECYLFIYSTLVNPSSFPVSGHWDTI